MLRLSRCTVLVSILTAYLHGNERIACMFEDHPGWGCRLNGISLTQARHGPQDSEIHTDGPSILECQPLHSMLAIRAS